MILWRITQRSILKPAGANLSYCCQIQTMNKTLIAEIKAAPTVGSCTGVMPDSQYGSHHVFCSEKKRKACQLMPILLRTEKHILRLLA